MKIKGITILRWLSLIELILIVMLEHRYFVNAVELQRENTMMLQIFVTVLAIIISICSIGKTNKFRYSIISASFLFIIICFRAIFSDNFSFLNTEFLSIFLKTIYWFFIFLFGYSVSQNFKDIKIPTLIMVVSLLMFMIKYIDIMHVDYSITNKNYTITAIYYLICNAAFVFCLKNKKIVGILLGLVLLFTWVSFKRSALMVLLIAGVIIIWENRRTSDLNYIFNRLKSLFLLLSALVIIYIILMGSSNILENNIANIWSIRFEEGDSRLLIQAEVIDLIYNADLIHLIFGYGQNAVIAATSFGLSAHNDYLEILYNYGIIGFIAFIVLIVHLLKERKYIRSRCNREIYNGYLFSLVIFLVASIPSHMLTYGTYFLFLILYIGFAIGEANKC